MSNRHDILYGDPSKDQVYITYFKGAMNDGSSAFLKAGMLHIIFNISNHILVFDDNVRLSISPGTLAIWYRGEDTNPQINQINNKNVNNCEYQKESVILSTPKNWLKTNFGRTKDNLHPMLKIILYENTGSLELGKIRSLLNSEMNLARALISPPIFNAAKPYWYSAKVMEIIALHLFLNDDTYDNKLFKNNIKYSNQRLVTLALDWLTQKLDQPLSLKALSRHVGFSSQYISRTFSETTGKTLSLTLRTLRIDKAAELLASKDYNVTEAAMEVGYNSLSHFTKVFISEKGIKPSEYQ